MRRNAEIMQYQKDQISYMLCILSIIFNIIYFVSIYTNRDIAPDAFVGADILINILFMMIVFLGSEKLKAYSEKWNIYIAIVGVVQFTRIFMVPAHYKQLEMLSEQKYVLVIVYIIISSILLLLAAANATINGRILRSTDDINKVGG